MDPAPLLDLMTKAGPYGLFLVMAWMWKLERTERIEAQKALRDLTASGTAAMNDCTNVLKNLRDTLFSRDTRMEPR